MVQRVLFLTVDTPIVVLYRDDHLLVLDKPSGLLAVPGRGADKQDCLSARAQAIYPAARVVHRLDRDTSGVFVMALNADAQRAIGRQFEDRQVEKTYHAVVAGVVAEDFGRIELPLRKDFDHPPRHMVDLGLGRSAETEWRVLLRGDDRTRLELHPRTGRSHQLRVHLQQIGHPILGDALYASPEALALADRLLLHSTALVLRNPTTGDWVQFYADCPF